MNNDANHPFTEATLHYSTLKASWYLEIRINHVRIYDDHFGSLLDIVKRALRMKLPYTLHAEDQRYYERDMHTLIDIDLNAKPPQGWTHV
jgi:hypothetical protein